MLIIWNWLLIFDINTNIYFSTNPIPFLLANTITKIKTINSRIIKVGTTMAATGAAPDAKTKQHNKLNNNILTLVMMVKRLIEMQQPRKPWVRKHQ